MANKISLQKERERDGGSPNGFSVGKMPFDGIRKKATDHRRRRSGAEAVRTETNAGT